MKCLHTTNLSRIFFLTKEKQKDCSMFSTTSMISLVSQPNLIAASFFCKKKLLYINATRNREIGGCVHIAQKIGKAWGRFSFGRQYAIIVMIGRYRWIMFVGFGGLPSDRDVCLSKWKKMLVKPIMVFIAVKVLTHILIT